MIKSLTELKRVAKEYSWELYLYKNLHDNTMIPHKYLGKVRSIEKLQTNAIKFEGGSWLYFPKKASQMSFERYLYNEVDTIVKIDEGNGVILGYHLRPLEKIGSPN